MKYLESHIEIDIRFSETDAMGVVWHGNYLKFFEDAREAFGKQFGIEYLDIHKKGFFVPIIHSECFHKASVYYGQRLRINARLHYKVAAKAVFEFEVINLENGEISATGSTTQVFLNAETRELQLIKPKFYSEWEEKQNWIESE